MKATGRAPNHHLSRQHRRGTRARRGAVMVAALVCLLVAAVVVLSMVRGAVAEHRQQRAGEWRGQAQSLATAGIDRAIAQLRAAPDYRGESWRVAADQLGGQAGVVAIRVETNSDRPRQRHIVVEADYPDDPLHRARATREVLATMP